jgi:hypothetical protein
MHRPICAIGKVEMPNNEENADANSVEDQDQIAKRAAELLVRLPPVYQWPDNLREELIEQITVRSRLCLIPAYRKERIGGLSESISSTYMILASGSGVTDSGGSASIDIDSLLFSVRRGQYMHSGIHPWVGQDTTGARINTVPYDPVAVGVPHTVVTGTGESPAIFTATNQRIEATKAGDYLVFSWFNPAPITGRSAGSVKIRSFNLDGTASSGTTFDWHTSIELVFGHSGIG